MGILGLFQKKKHNGHQLTQEDAEKAGELNKLRFENKRLALERENEINRLRAEREQLRLTADIDRIRQELGDNDGEEDGQDDNEVFNTLLLSILPRLKGSTLPAAAPVSANPPGAAAPPLIHLSDEELQEAWGQIPKAAKKVARTLSESSIKAYIQQRVGNCDEDTLNRAVQIVKSG